MTLNKRATHTQSHPDSKVRGANKGPIWGRQDPGGPHVGPMNFVICQYRLWWGAADQCTLSHRTNTILWYRESWIIQLKYTFGTKQEIIPASSHRHGHTNSYMACICIRTWTKVVKRKHLIKPRGFGAYSSTSFKRGGEDVPAPWEYPIKLQSSCSSPKHYVFNWYITTYAIEKFLVAINSNSVILQ